eukprot:scaffold68146_cov20-Tisochrysis_lutea.AAC.2
MKLAQCLQALASSSKMLCITPPPLLQVQDNKAAVEVVEQQDWLSLPQHLMHSPTTGPLWSLTLTRPAPTAPVPFLAQSSRSCASSQCAACSRKGCVRLLCAACRRAHPGFPQWHWLVGRTQTHEGHAAGVVRACGAQACRRCGPCSHEAGHVWVDHPQTIHARKRDRAQVEDLGRNIPVMRKFFTEGHMQTH